MQIWNIFIYSNVSELFVSKVKVFINISSIRSEECSSSRLSARSHHSSSCAVSFCIILIVNLKGEMMASRPSFNAEGLITLNYEFSHELGMMTGNAQFLSRRLKDVERMLGGQQFILYHPFLFSIPLRFPHLLSSSAIRRHQYRIRFATVCFFSLY